jgi:uncharacterized protein (TIGR02594 family)
MLWKCIPAFVLLLSACTTTQSVPVDTAITHIGLSERQDRKELKDLIGVDPVRTEWCAAFVNAILEINNIPGSSSVSDVPLMARSFLKWGEEIHPNDIQYGDVVIFPRGNSEWKGHVGFYAGTYVQTGEWIILGGNQNNEVKYSLYYPGRALAVRRYKE